MKLTCVYCYCPSEAVQGLRPLSKHLWCVHTKSVSLVSVEGCYQGLSWNLCYLFARGCVANLACWAYIYSGCWRHPGSRAVGMLDVSASMSAWAQCCCNLRGTIRKHVQCKAAGLTCSGNRQAGWMMMIKYPCQMCWSHACMHVGCYVTCCSVCRHEDRPHLRGPCKESGHSARQLDRYVQNTVGLIGC